MNTQKGISTGVGVIIFLFIVALAFGGAFAYEYYGTQFQIPILSNQINFNNQNINGQTACTQEAKLCPDGSYVGRTGPNCEFAECPVVDEIANWKTYANDEYGFVFKYPKEYDLFERTEGDLLFEYYPARVVRVAFKDDWADSSFYVSADNDASAVAKCLEGSTGVKNINGVEWHIIYEEIGDAAMGGERGINTNYKIVRGGYCFGIEGLIHYRIVGYGGIINTGKSNATVEETNAQNASIERQSQMMGRIFSTFKFAQ